VNNDFLEVDGLCRLQRRGDPLDIRSMRPERHILEFRELGEIKGGRAALGYAQR